MISAFFLIFDTFVQFTEQPGKRAGHGIVRQQALLFKQSAKRFLRIGKYGDGIKIPFGKIENISDIDPLDYEKKKCYNQTKPNRRIM